MRNFYLVPVLIETKRTEYIKTDLAIKRHRQKPLTSAFTVSNSAGVVDLPLFHFVLAPEEVGGDEAARVFLVTSSRDHLVTDDGGGQGHGDHVAGAVDDAVVVAVVELVADEVALAGRVQQGWRGEERGQMSLNRRN